MSSSRIGPVSPEDTPKKKVSAPDVEAFKKIMKTSEVDPEEQRKKFTPEEEEEENVDVEKEKEPLPSPYKSEFYKTEEEAKKEMEAKIKEIKKKEVLATKKPFEEATKKKEKEEPLKKESLFEEGTTAAKKAKPESPFAQKEAMEKPSKEAPTKEKKGPPFESTFEKTLKEKRAPKEEAFVTKKEEKKVIHEVPLTKESEKTLQRKAPLEKREEVKTEVVIKETKEAPLMKKEEGKLPLAERGTKGARGEKKEEKEEEKITVLQPQNIPAQAVAEATAITGSVATSLSHPVQELFKTMVGTIIHMTNNGITVTEITLSSPNFTNSPFFGSKITLTKYSTAPNSFNITLAGSEKAVDLFSANVEGLMQAFNKKDLGFKIGRLEVEYATERPVFRRKEAPKGDKETKK